MEYSIRYNVRVLLSWLDTTCHSTMFIIRHFLSCLNDDHPSKQTLSQLHPEPEVFSQYSLHRMIQVHSSFTCVNFTCVFVLKCISQQPANSSPNCFLNSKWTINTCVDLHSQQQWGICTRFQTVGF